MLTLRTAGNKTKKKSRQAVEICARIIQEKPKYDLNTSILLNNLAVYSLMSGDIDFNGIFQCYKLSIKHIPRQLVSVSASVLINMASLLITHGHYSRAHKLLHKTISFIDRELDSTDNDKMHKLKMMLFADLYMTLAVTYASQNQNSAPLDYFQSALKIFEGHLPPGNDKFGWAYSNLAKIDFKYGKYHDAIENGKKALTIYLQCFQSGHPTIADSYQLLGTIYRENWS